MLVSNGFDNRVFQLLNIVRKEVGQLTMFGVTPHGFDGVEIGSIRGKPFDLQPIGAAVQQFSGGRAVNRPTIPHENQLAAELAVQMSNKLHDRWCAEVFFLIAQIDANNSTPVEFQAKLK